MFNKIYKFKSSSLSEILLILLAILTFIYALYIAIRYARQIPLDLFSFRQTQTALTAYWFIKDGFSLAYQTPVAGPPWSIPFEFPIYQYIVALISKIFGFSLNATGRLVSFSFLSLCVIPVRAITKSLKLSETVFHIFVALLFSSPLYLYWGRTFMIETAAVFFSVVAIKYFIDIVQLEKSSKPSLLFLVFISLSILQKATTGLPVLALLSFIFLFMSIKETNSLNIVFFGKKALLSLVYFGIPLAIGIIWTLYTDQIKELNGLGLQLTSSALSGWNWGTLSQRFSFTFYDDVIWRRIFERNLSGTLGLSILAICFFSNCLKSIKLIVVISTLLALTPLYLFTNLHIVHDYYQTGNLIFLIFAVSVSLGHVLNNLFEKKIIVFVLTIIMVICNYINFSNNYLDNIKVEFNKENSRDYAVSEILKREIPKDKYFVAFGNDWSSSLSYLSERKSFMVPPWFKQYAEVSINPEHFIKDPFLGGIVLCPSVTSPTISELSLWSSNARNWKVGQVLECYVAIPESLPIKKATKISAVDCSGAIDSAIEVPIGNNKVLSVSGWIRALGVNAAVSEKIYVTLTKQKSEPLYFEALRVNHTDISLPLGHSNNLDIGYSRVINTTLLIGKYDVGIVRLNSEHLETCQFKKEVKINDQSFND